MNSKGKAAKAKAIEVRAKSKSSGPNLDALQFPNVDEGGMLFNRQDSVVFRVTSLTLNRALAIANAHSLPPNREVARLE
jgi:hypothetical protein